METKEHIAELERDVVIAKLDTLISLADLRESSYDVKKLEEIKEYVLNWKLC
jgi:hypothetical protein